MSRRQNRHHFNMVKEQEKLQTRKLVMKYTLDVKKQDDVKKGQNILKEKEEVESSEDEYPTKVK